MAGLVCEKVWLLQQPTPASQIHMHHANWSQSEDAAESGNRGPFPIESHPVAIWGKKQLEWEEGTLSTSKVTSVMKSVCLSLCIKF